MYWIYFFHSFTSMVINNFDISGISVFPFETESPLLVYPNAVLTFSISGQGFESVRRRNAEVIKR